MAVVFDDQATLVFDNPSTFNTPVPVVINTEIPPNDATGGLILDEVMGPGFLIFFQVPGQPGGPIADSEFREREATVSLFKSEYTLDKLYDEDDEILAIIMAFMFTKR
jgi:hypothetical protein